MILLMKEYNRLYGCRRFWTFAPRTTGRLGLVVWILLSGCRRFWTFAPRTMGRLGLVVWILLSGCSPSDRSPSWQGQATVSREAGESTHESYSDKHGTAGAPATVSATDPDSATMLISPSDPLATTQTKALFRNLNQVRISNTLFGHQDALAYGVYWMNEAGRSDVLEVAGSYPAVYGWDLGGIERGGATNLDGIAFEQMQHFIREVHARGGVSTLSWHMDNPLTGGDAWDVAPGERPVHNILPGGSHHHILLRNLDKAADFIRELTTAPGDIEVQRTNPDFWETDGSSSGMPADTITNLQHASTAQAATLQPGYSDAGRSTDIVPATTPTAGPHPIPIILRPWHEMNGSWFWWGSPHTSPEAYKELYRFTVTYLRDVHQLNHILWAYSPNSLSELVSPEQYWEWYPGDAYTDVLGFDDYYTTWGGYGDEDGVERMAAHLEWLVTEAEKRGKIPALTETGEYTMLSDTTWYTNQLLRAIDHNEVTRRIAWVLVWRNANNSDSRADHFYVPYPGHPATGDFIKFVSHPMIWLENDLPDLYQ